MKTYFWKIQAAIVSNLLNQTTTVEDLKTNFVEKMIKINEKLFLENPDLLKDVERVQKLSNSDISAQCQDLLVEFVQYLEKLTPSIDPIQKMQNAMFLQKNSTCQCPDLLRGHLTTCNFKAKG